MDIIEPNETFDFSKLSLNHPSSIQGGAFFTKIEYNKKPLYIQTIKGQTKQGLIKTGKKYYCDLMFDKNYETLIHWFENLEERCQQLICERKDTWFENSLEETDVESAFNSTIRTYKSGKYYLVRTSIKNNHINNLPSINIYDERQIPLTIDDINSDTFIITILEIQGIKFTTRNFQIEIELKQIMVLDNEKVFNNCLIKTKKQEIETILDKNIPEEQQSIKTILNTIPVLEQDTNPIEQLINTIEPDINPIEQTKTILEQDLEEKVNNDKDNDEDEILIDIENLDKNIEENTDELKEITNLDLTLDNLETIQLKKPNQVYFELYKEARNKAKQAKKNAILAYLEAKNIKKTYMLENINDSDSDFDAEIDEVSESELEGL
jgi:hypothetical protein